MIERKEGIVEKFSVIFVLWQNGIQLEKRMSPQDELFGYTIIPGEKSERGETYTRTLKRGVMEEYGVKVKKFEQVGRIRTEDENGVSFRHVFMVTEWEGGLRNVEGKNRHIRTSLKKAKEMCTHPISQKVLDYVEGYLSRQNR